MRHDVAARYVEPTGELIETARTLGVDSFWSSVGRPTRVRVLRAA